MLGPGGRRASWFSGGRGEASVAEFATAPLPHARKGCDIAAATKEEVEVGMVLAEQVAHALRGKPESDPHGSRKVNAASLSGFVW